MQAHQAEGRRPRDLRRPAAQATARLRSVSSGQWTVGRKGEVTDPNQEEGRPTSSSELSTAHCPLPTAKLVLFLDEIDAVRSTALPNAKEIARLGALRLAREGLDPADLKPLYLRDKVALTEAERAAH